MLIGEPLLFTKQFIEALNKAIDAHKPGQSLSCIQQKWLTFCILAILVTNSVCWAKFERASLGGYSMQALSWMFRRSKIPWDLLLRMSVQIILTCYGITEGVLGLDDTDNNRSQNTKKIHRVHKLKDKKTGGYMSGQSIIFLVLITDKITIPVGFEFYMPDPEMTAWYKRKKQAKKLGKKTPKKPAKNSEYPTKQEIALQLLKEFEESHSHIKIKCIIADALYGTADFTDNASKLFGGVQLISQLRTNQNIHFRGKKCSVSEHFNKFPGVIQKIIVRGLEETSIIFNSARLIVDAHGKKRFVIAIKYENENDYRFLVATDLTWRTQDIIQTYTLRWLVEVFIQDWKSYEGWGNLTKQTGEEGSSRSLILSLLTDHCLLFHPEQLARIENKLPAYTVGSLQLQIKMEGLFSFIQNIVHSEDPEKQLTLLAESVKKVFPLAPSKKHMVNRDLGRIEPSPSLKYKGETFARAC